MKYLYIIFSVLFLWWFSYASCWNGILELSEGEQCDRNIAESHDLLEEWRFCDFSCNLQVLDTSCSSSWLLFDWNADGLINEIDTSFLFWSIDHAWINDLDLTNCNDSENALCQVTGLMDTNCDWNIDFDDINTVNALWADFSLSCSDYQSYCEDINSVPECSDYDAFDYNDDWYVDDKDVRYLRLATRARSEITSCDGLIMDTNRGGQFCCPEWKICDLNCGKYDYDQGILSRSDGSALQRAIRTKTLPRTCQVETTVCEETQYEVEHIRFARTWRVIAARYLWDTDSSTDNNLYTTDTQSVKSNIKDLTMSIVK